MASIGWFGEDVIDFAGGALSDAGDVFSDVAEEIPMAPELAGALKDVVNGPLRDFARSDLGMTVLRAMSTTIYGPFAWAAGPQIAALAFAVPGLARGEDFWTAWLSELQWRGQKTAEIVAPMASEALTPKIKEAAEQLSAIIPYEDVRAYALGELSARLRVDEWTTAMAMAVLGLAPIPSRAEFDPASGRSLASSGGGATLGLRRRSSGAPSSRPAMNACEAAAEASRVGQSLAIQRALRSKCYAAQDAGEIDGSGRTIAGGDVDAGDPSVRNGTGSNVGLGLVIGAAALALVWWSRS